MYINKEDAGLSPDVEIQEQKIENIGDTPLERYILSFPNEKNPHEKVEQLYRMFYAQYVDNAQTKPLDELKEAVVKKARMTPLEIDFVINALIQEEFDCELELDYGISMEIITSTPLPELLDVMTMKERFKIVRTPVDELDNSLLLKNNVFRVNKGDNKRAYATNGRRKHYEFQD